MTEESLQVCAYTFLCKNSAYALAWVEGLVDIPLRNKKSIHLFLFFEMSSTFFREILLGLNKQGYDWNPCSYPSCLMGVISQSKSLNASLYFIPISFSVLLFFLLYPFVCFLRLLANQSF